MSASDRVGYDAYFVPPEIQNEGVALPLREGLNWTASVSVPTDDEANNVTKVPMGGAGGGSFSVTGTGFPSVIAGVLQPAAKLVANSDVSSSANIALTKLALGGADGNVVVRVSGANAWGQVDLSSTNAIANTLGVAHGGTGVTSLGTSGDFLYNNGGVVGDASHFSYDGTLGLSCGLPVGGDTSAPFRWRTVTLTAAGGSVTLSAAQAACVEMIVSGATTTTFVFPTSNAGEHHFVRTTGTSTWAASGQSGVSFNSSTPSGWIYFGGTDYKKEGM